MSDNIIQKGNRKFRVVMPDEVEKFRTESDAEMDERVEYAIKAAIERTKVCKKPIARYDPAAKKAYMEYPDGTRKYD